MTATGPCPMTRAKRSVMPPGVFRHDDANGACRIPDPSACAANDYAAAAPPSGAANCRLPTWITIRPPPVESRPLPRSDNITPHTLRRTNRRFGPQAWTCKIRQSDPAYSTGICAAPISLRHCGSSVPMRSLSSCGETGDRFRNIARRETSSARPDPRRSCAPRC